jgi:hypothetical protein
MVRLVATDHSRLLGLQCFGHAGRKLDVEVFDGEFAGNEAGKKAIAGLFKINNLL